MKALSEFTGVPVACQSRVFAKARGADDGPGGVAAAAAGRAQASPGQAQTALRVDSRTMKRGAGSSTVGVSPASSCSIAVAAIWPSS